MFVIDERIIQLAAILLIPMAPAFVLYKFLPSTISVAGPFKGLNIRLTGAFGGYFVLVILASTYFNVQEREKVSPVYEEWTIEGAIRLPGKSQDELDENLVKLKLHPPSKGPPEPPVGDKIQFSVRVPIKRHPDGSIDTQYFTKVYVSYPGYERDIAEIDASDLTGSVHRYDVGLIELKELLDGESDRGSGVEEGEAERETEGEVITTEWQE